jgi:hypothetical protein
MLPLSPFIFIAAAVAWLPDDAPFSAALDDNELDPLKRDNHGPRDGVTTAAFIGHVGYWAHRQSRGFSTWPFPLEVDCNDLSRLARKRGVLVSSKPDPGAILVRWSHVEQRFTRASIVVEIDECPLFGNWTYDCRVIEGGASHRRRPRNGIPRVQMQWVRRARRRCCPMLGDRFISWVDLDARDRIAQVA